MAVEVKSCERTANCTVHTPQSTWSTYVQCNVRDLYELPEAVSKADVSPVSQSVGGVVSQRKNAILLRLLIGLPLNRHFSANTF